MTEEQLTNLVKSRGYSVMVSRGEGLLGVATLVHNSLGDANVENLVPGRLQQCHIGDYRILNVYAPAGTNMATERREFFSAPLLAACRKERLVMGGDYNSVIDQQDVEENYRNKRSIELRELVRTFSLQDSYRATNHSTVYTFNRPGSTSARLDRFYTSSDIPAGQTVHYPALSDHMAVMLTLTLPIGIRKDQRQGNRWKLNVSILKDRSLRNHIQELIGGSDLTEISEWEALKGTIIHHLKDFSVLKAMFRKTTFKVIIHTLEKALVDKDWEEVAYAKSRLKVMIDHTLQGFMIRGRSNKEDPEEQATISHAMKEMKRGKQAQLSQLRIGGKVEENPERIKKEVKEYYQALYNGHHRTISGEVRNTGIDFTPNLDKEEEFLADLPQVTEDQAGVLEMQVTELEVRETLEECKSGTAPGPDGLPYEFYRAYAGVIIPILTRAFNKYIEEKQVPDSYKKGATRLIPKVEGVPTVEQLRPITLQSCEYKILSKIMTKRLLGSLGHVIGPWQHCAIPGRSITKPIIRTLSAMEYMNKHQIDGYILSTDIFKAYDRTHVGYITRVMRRMGYTQRGVDVLIALLEGGYTDIQIFDGVRVYIILGLKQGDPLSVPLFIINMEPLVRRIHNIVTGVPVGPCLQKTEAFMDDVNITSTNRKDLVKIDAVFMDYESLSCTLLSRSRKTKIMGFGRWAEESQWELDWVQPVDQMRILGIQLGQTMEATSNLTWKMVVAAVRGSIQKWVARRGLTMAARARIVNRLILGKLWYTAQLLPAPQAVIQDIEGSISFLLFQDKVERIKLEQLYADRSEGGLGLVNVQAKCQALLAKTGYTGIEAKCKHLLYWMGIRLRQYVEVQGPRSEAPTVYFKELGDLVKEVFSMKDTIRGVSTKLLYKAFMNTPPPSRIQDLGDLPVQQVCRRSGGLGDAKLEEHYFQMATNTLPTKSRLHYLNPRRWESPTCTWCRTNPANINHIFIECNVVQDVWGWLRGKVRRLEPQSATWLDSELLWLTYPRNKQAAEITYIVMKTIYLWWTFQREARILTVERLTALIKHDLVLRESRKAPRLSDLLHQIM